METSEGARYPCVRGSDKQPHLSRADLPADLPPFHPFSSLPFSSLPFPCTTPLALSPSLSSLLLCSIPSSSLLAVSCLACALLTTQSAETSANQKPRTLTLANFIPLQFLLSTRRKNLFNSCVRSENETRGETPIA